MGQSGTILKKAVTFVNVMLKWLDQHKDEQMFICGRMELIVRQMLHSSLTVKRHPWPVYRLEIPNDVITNHEVAIWPL